MAKTLEEQVLAAEKPGFRAADLEPLIERVLERIAALGAERETLDRQSLDPSLDDAAATAARQQAREREFAASRWTARLETLRALFTTKTQSEQAKARRSERDAAAAEAAELAAEIRDTIPEAWAKLSGLFTRIRESDARVAAANRLGGGDPIVTAEEQARGYRGWMWPNLGGPVARLTEMQLPAFDREGSAWPVDQMAEMRAAMSHDIDAQLRANREQQRRREEQEKTRWKRVATSYFGGGMITEIANRDGSSGATNRPLIVEMDDRQIALARARGVTVEPFDETKHSALDIHTALKARVIAEIRAGKASTHRSTLVQQVTG